MSEQEDEGKVLGNFRAGFTSFVSAILIAVLPFVFDEKNKELIEQLRILCPIMGGALAYTISIPLNYLVSKIDVGRYKGQLGLIDEELEGLNKDTEQERIVELLKEKGIYRKRIFDINSRSLFK